MSDIVIEPGQMYQEYVNKNIYVVIERRAEGSDTWIIFDISRSRYSWDYKTNFRTQYRRLA